jgi:hypothetical protein
VSGDTLTITGPDLTSYATKAYVDARDIGDLSISGSTISSPTNANLTLNSSNGSVIIEGINVEGSTISTTDSSPVLVNSMTISGNLTAPDLVTNTITSSDSTEVVINDGMRVTGTLTAGTIVASTISPPDSITGTYTISSPTTITLDPVEEIITDAPIVLKSYNSGSLPTGSAGAMISISNNGNKPAYYDGTANAWKYVFDNSNV